MPLSLNEIKDRALAFSREWEGEQSERAEAQTFWNEFFNVFGVTRKRIASFEKPVKDLPLFGEEASKGGRIDLFWRGTMIAEHKSRGKDLDTAYKQALGYFSGLPERDLPRYIVVSDFARIRLYDLESDTKVDFPLKDFYKNIKLFGFIAGYTTQRIEAQDPVNIKAAERMGKLHDKLRASGYEGHTLEALLVRLLFCLFAEDTTLFEPRGSFRDFIENCTREDGADLGPQLSLLFQVLDTREDRRQKILDESISVFPYVNGRLFAEPLPIPTCDRTMRDILLDCCALDWGRISPAIFGALFQCVMDEEGTARRRNLGAHYTSEENILKLIKPLFLDDLWAEFHAAKRSKTKLFELHKKISKLKFLDPACGCGNFLVIAYRELRLLELEILRAARDTGERHLDIFSLVQIDVDQFCGIEIEEFPAQIAQVALWLTDHQMNMKVSEEFGQYFRRLPLVHAPNIVCGNALRMDWNDVISVYDVNYILGNPPFVGHQWRTPQQMEDMTSVWGSEGRFGRLDYVTAWYLKAVRYIAGNERIAGLLDNLADLPKPPREHVKIAFVSTNSISQGEQVGILWSELLRRDVRIHFAHRTFSWSNEARGKAAVHCVIIGCALFDADCKMIYDYPDIKGEPHALRAANINPYLVDAPNVILPSRTDPSPGIPQMKKGSQPTDGGYLILGDDEKEELVEKEAGARRWVHPYMGGEELVQGTHRWCLWLKGISPAELNSLPYILKRVAGVREARLKSPTKSVRDYAEFPTLFTQDRQPKGDYLAVPEVSSETRRFIPMAFLPVSVIASNKLQLVIGATHYHFGILSSTMHMAWVRTVAGRLKSDYSYAPSVYNNFPWPSEPTDKQKQAIEEAAQGVLDARAAHPGSSLADLYNPIAMPPNLRQAHQALDKAVDAAYGKKSFASDAERVAFLFELYHKYTSLLPAPEKPKKRSRKVTGKVAT